MSVFDAFIRATDNLIEFEANFNDIEVARHSVASLEIHSDEIQILWKVVKSKYEGYLQAVDDDEDDDEDATAKEQEKNDIPIVKSRHQTAYTAYVRCLTAIREMASSLERRSYSKADSIPRLEIPNAGVRLPPCDMDDFSGDYTEWPSFRDLFEAIYIQNPRLSPVEKLFHLNQKTKGEARDIVKNAPLTNDGFASAWRELKERFENKRILVNSQYRILFSVESVKSESGSALKKMQSTVNGCLSALKLQDIDVRSWDSMLVYFCSTRLPHTTLALWEQSLTSKDTLPTWKQFDAFLTSRYQTLETLTDIRATNQKQSDASTSRNVRSHSAHVTAPPCKLCPKEKHTIRVCPQFLKMNVENRFSCIRKHGLCINCFARSHAVKDCKSNHNCFRCHKRHNTLLHREIAESKIPGNESSKNQSNSSSGQQKAHSTQLVPAPDNESTIIQTCLAAGTKSVLLGTAMIKLKNKGRECYARALLDSGSEGTFISEKIRRRLQLPSYSVSANITGVGASVSAKSIKACRILITSALGSDVSIETTALILPKITGDLPSCSIDPSYFSCLPKIPLADQHFATKSSVDVLIGADILPTVMRNGIKRNICGSLIAQETVFGWILTGPIKQSSSLAISVHFCTCDDGSIERAITRFWEVEDLPQQRLDSAEDYYCEELFKRTTKRNEEGRYIVELPFKESFPKNIQLGASRKIALAQFLRNEARLNKNLQFKTEYDNVVREYLDLGHMEEVRQNSREAINSTFYLPHHAVIKAESTTTKVRVVFNASSPSDNSVSLNDVLYTGPVLQADLTLLILKWRFFRYVFNADIQKMYRQILVTSSHTPFQRILFRQTPGEEVSDFELKTVTFGVNCAPYLAIRTLRQLADDVETSLPLASALLKESMYVDDVLAGGHTIDTTIAARIELTSALDSAGFPLRKWASNSREILQDIPKEHLLSEEFLSLDENSVAKTLGIRWNAKLDEFYFHPTPFPETAKYTKREILSQISKLFDPAGWLSPIVICAKILMQEIWLARVDWDEPLPLTCVTKWMSFRENFPCISDIKIRRWVEYLPERDVEIHGFCDASEKAYAAALYVRIQTGDVISTHLLTAKSRVAPVKTLSVPRLELCGAVLLAEMVQAFSQHMPMIKEKLFFWTDSTIVLAWLQKPPCHWKNFIANRVSRILQSIGPSTWLHVESESNPADLASRGVAASELRVSDLWWHGPAWLPLPLAHWRNRSAVSPFETDMERKPIRVHAVALEEAEDILERFSKYSRAVRVLAYVNRFIRRTWPNKRVPLALLDEKTLTLTSQEISEVQVRLIKLAQKRAYTVEYTSLQSKRSISSASSILNLNPFLDAKELIRVNGRLVASPSLSYNERHPIIIPYNCQLSRLLVKFHHEISLHGGNSLVLRLIRTQFWIPKAKNLIKTTIHNCKTCVLHKNKVRTQLMGVLPPERTVLERPFLHTGLDFAGPFDIKNAAGRSRVITKGYVCVFVCFATKAIHLEAVSDLSTPAFLAAFNRFIARRSCPSHVYSDNGKNFVGASRKLYSEFLIATRDTVLAQQSHHNLVWHFIPPGAPHMGGLWEAGVRSFKIHFVKVIGVCKLTFEEFMTVLTRIEACLNSRPISPMSDNPNDIAALTPGHFLTGGPLLAPPEPRIDDTPLSIINRWQRLKALQQEFCVRWKNEYLTELHKRNKWKQSKEDLKVDSLVVIREDNLPVTSWRLGRVMKVYAGKDGRVRVADIRTERGIITRPIVKLCSLPSE